jgi:hypothetical protein
MNQYGNAQMKAKRKANSKVVKMALPTGLADSGPVATEKTLTKPRGSAFAEPLNVGYCGLAVGLNGCGGWI